MTTTQSYRELVREAKKLFREMGFDEVDIPAAAIDGAIECGADDPRDVVIEALKIQAQSRQDSEAWAREIEHEAGMLHGLRGIQDLYGEAVPYESWMDEEECGR